MDGINKGDGRQVWGVVGCHQGKIVKGQSRRT